MPSELNDFHQSYGEFAQPDPTEDEIDNLMANFDLADYNEFVPYDEEVDEPRNSVQQNNFGYEHPVPEKLITGEETISE